jgi:hypothetical protein
MARELEIQVNVVTHEAKQRLTEIDQATDQAAAAAAQMSLSVAQLEAKLALARGEMTSSKREMSTLVDTMQAAATTQRAQLQPELEKSAQGFVTAREKAAAFTQQIKDIHAPTQAAGLSLSTATTALTQLAGAFGVYLSAQAVVGAIVATTEYANNLQRMSAQTGVSTTALQQLGYAAKLANVDISTVTTGISMLERRLASGDASFLEALRTTKLSIQELRGLSPDQLFFRIAEAVDAIEDPYKRAQAAQELFSRGGAQLLPVAQNLKAIKDQAPIISPEDVETLGKYNNQIDDLGARLTVFKANVLIPLIAAWDQAANAAALFFRVTDKGPGGTPDYGDAYTKTKANQLQGPALPKGAGVFGKTFDLDNKADLAAVAAIEKTITDEVRQQIEINKERNAEIQKLHDLYVKLNVQYDIENAKLVKAHDITKQIVTAVEAEAAARGRVMASRGQTWGGEAISDDPQVKLRKELDELHGKKKAGISQEYQEQEIYDKMAKAELDAARAGDALQQSMGQTAAAASKLPKALDPAISAFNGLTQAITLAAQTSHYFGDPESISSSMHPYGMAARNLSKDTSGDFFKSYGAGGPVSKDGLIFAHAGEFVLNKDDVQAGKGSGGVTIGDVHIHGNVDNALTARRLADQVAANVLRKLRNRDAIAWGTA